jgi:hypothetical protein
LARLGISGRHLPLKIAAHAKQGFAHHWKFFKVHMALNLPRYIRQLCRQQAEVIQSHENEHVRGTGKGEARH